MQRARSVEPRPENLTNVALRYFLATRPAFLSVTFVAALLGLASAIYDGVMVQPLIAVVTIVLALIAHAAVNVLNDYYDALNGTDAINAERIFPFTGGSRFIQNGVLTPHDTAWFGIALAAVVVCGGLWLISATRISLATFGISGLLIGWAYSAPPLKFNSRGLGELCVWLGFLLIALGADFVQRQTFSVSALTVAGGYALLVTNVLYLNQFPDRSADAATGKRHLVVRLGARAKWGYVALALAAYAWLVIAVALQFLPPLALIALLPVPLSARAARDTLRWSMQPQRLVLAIRLTIAAALLHGLLIAIALAATAWAR